MAEGQANAGHALLEAAFVLSELDGGSGTVHVMLMEGGQIDLEVEGGSTVRELRQAVADRLETQPSFVKLLYGPEVLHNDQGVGPLVGQTVIAIIVLEVENLMQTLKGSSFKNINDVRADGKTVLHAAIEQDQLDLVSMIVDDVSFTRLNDPCKRGFGPGTYVGMHALHMATLKGQHEVVGLLLDCERYDVNATGRETVLDIAVKHGHRGIVQALLNHPRLDAEVLNRVNGFSTALHIAAEKGHLEIALAILNDDRCTEADARRSRGANPHHDAVFLAQKAKHMEVAHAIARHPKVNKKVWTVRT